MLAFFSQRNGQVQSTPNLDGIDIVTGNYLIRIRISGITVTDCNKGMPGVEIINQHLDFTKEEPTKTGIQECKTIEEHELKSQEKLEKTSVDPIEGKNLLGEPDASPA